MSFSMEGSNVILQVMKLYIWYFLYRYYSSLFSFFHYRQRARDISAICRRRRQHDRCVISRKKCERCLLIAIFSIYIFFIADTGRFLSAIYLQTLVEVFAAADDAYLHAAARTSFFGSESISHEIFSLP